MTLVNGLTTAFNKLRRALGRGILRIAPRHGFLDTIFHSYDDWREFQEQGSAPIKNDKLT